MVSFYKKQQNKGMLVRTLGCTEVPGGESMKLHAGAFRHYHKSTSKPRIFKYEVII